MGRLSKADLEAMRAAAAVMPPGQLNPGRRGRTFGEATISINGGPEVPMAVAKEALKIIKSRGLRLKAAEGANRDLEEVTGAAPAQEDREAEAGGIAADRLRSIVERIERLTQERKDLAGDIKDIFSEAKSAGFDNKALRRVIRMRTWEPAELEEHETLIDLYRRALGM